MRCSFDLLHPLLRSVIGRYGYRAPTRIQELAVPVILSGVDALLIAPTGSGKTEAALFPVFSRILELRDAKELRSGEIFAVYVTPLKALNRDIFSRMENIASELGIKFYLRHGDSTPGERRRFLEALPQVFVTTPETLNYLLTLETVRRGLRGLKFVIVDELHELMEDERGSELSVVLERLADLARGRVQRVGLSATVASPEEARKFLTGGRYAVVVEDDTRKRIEVEVVPGVDGQRAREIEEVLNVDRGTAARIAAIEELTKSHGSTIIFTNTRDAAEWLSSLLRRLMGDAVGVHHGSLDRSERLDSEGKLRSGLLKAVVATSSLELGIDIGHVDLVIQYASPRQAVRLVQRVGRSRHLVSLTSKGVIIPAPDVFDLLESIVLARRAVDGDLERQRIPTNRLDVLAHQVAAVVIERGRVSVRELYELLTRSYCFRELSPSKLLEVLEFLAATGVVRLMGETVLPGRRTRSYFFSTTMIPDERKYAVVDVISGKKVGTLDEEFVIACCAPGEVFILAGKPWSVLSVEGDKVLVKPAEELEGTLPHWVGELIPVDRKVSREVYAIIRRLAAGDPKVWLDYKRWRGALEEVRAVVEQHAREGYPAPSENVLVVEIVEGGTRVILFSCLGSKGNAALGALLSAVLTELTGSRCGYHSTPYVVLLAPARPADERTVLAALKNLAAADASRLRRMLCDYLRGTPTYLWKLHQVARKMGVIAPDVGTNGLGSKLRALAGTPVEEEAFNELLSERFDVDLVSEYLRPLVLSGRVVVISGRGVSPLAKSVLEGAAFKEASKHVVPKEVLAEVIKRRINSQDVKLACLLCGWSSRRNIGDLEETPACPRCGSRFLAPLRPGDEDALSLVSKAIRGGTLSRAEKSRLEELRRKADLVLTYGKYAVIALSARGVGVRTAVRVLSALKLGEREFYKAIVEAEADFVRTRRYWDERR